MIDGLFGRADPRPIAELLAAIDAAFPLPVRRRAELPKDIYRLSRSLTADRGERDDGYLGKPAMLSAYLRYFLPWNVYRLGRLIPALGLKLAPDDAVLDLGSGPLTFPIALWLSRPDLRTIPLEIRCLDRTAKALEAGALLFETLRTMTEAGSVPGPNAAWRLRPIRGSLGTRVDGKRAALVVAANMLNELFRSDRIPAAVHIAKTSKLLSALCADSGTLLLVEPGIPPSAEILSALRSAFIASGRAPTAPCTHAGACPMPGGRGRKWCHFAFESDAVPDRLKNLSAAAGIPKDRAVLSFLMMGPRQEVEAGLPEENAFASIRIVSDAFPLPDGGQGRYGCSAGGLTLAHGSRSELALYESGTLLTCPPARDSGERDPKSGARLVRLDGSVRSTRR